jgi:hypothetical protein
MKILVLLVLFVTIAFGVFGGRRAQPTRSRWPKALAPWLGWGDPDGGPRRGKHAHEHET